MTRRGRSDEQLMEYMDLVQLSYLVSREGGWDAIADWMDVLSGGEKQRVAVNAHILKIYSHGKFMYCFTYNTSLFGFRWHDCFIMLLSLLFWMNVQVLYL